jgi:hypothetical protein
LLFEYLLRLSVEANREQTNDEDFTFSDNNTANNGNHDMNIDLGSTQLPVGMYREDSSVRSATLAYKNMVNNNNPGEQQHQPSPIRTADDRFAMLIGQTNNVASLKRSRSASEGDIDTTNNDAIDNEDNNNGLSGKSKKAVRLCLTQDSMGFYTGSNSNSSGSGSFGVGAGNAHAFVGSATGPAISKRQSKDSPTKTNRNKMQTAAVSMDEDKDADDDRAANMRLTGEVTSSGLAVMLEADDDDDIEDNNHTDRQERKAQIDGEETQFSDDYLA